MKGNRLVYVWGLFDVSQETPVLLRKYGVFVEEVDANICKQQNELKESVMILAIKLKH